MIKQTLSALAIIAVASTVMIGDAEAGKRGFKFHKKHFKHHFLYTPKFHGGCYHLKKKALYTGSRYWWKKYQICKIHDD